MLAHLFILSKIRVQLQSYIHTTLKLFETGKYSIIQ